MGDQGVEERTVTTRLVLGGPGAGKTERMMRKVETALERGVPPDRIAYTSFTRRAAYEARDRAAERFGFTQDDAPHFRTLHALAFRALGLSRAAVVGQADWEALGELLRTPFSGRTRPEDGMATGIPIGDRMVTIDGYARARCLTLEEAWREHDESVGWWALRRFDEAYRQYKADLGRWDFADMIEAFPVECDPLPVEVAILDEAQDLTTAQWRMARHAFSRATEKWIAGDDDQAIYPWAGADVERFLSLKVEREVLPTSHRLPVEVFREAGRVISQVERRYEKRFVPRGHRGTVSWVTPETPVDLSQGTWLALARNHAHLEGFERMARTQGVVYRTARGLSVDPEHVRAIRTWEALRRGGRVVGASVNRALGLCKGATPVADEKTTYGLEDLGIEDAPIWHDALDRLPAETREYYVMALRGKERLDDEPRVRISTIHGAKGAEADHVLLKLDVSSRTFRSYQRSPDDEHRVFYVGMTRARKTLTLMECWDRQAYRMPL